MQFDSEELWSQVNCLSDISSSKVLTKTETFDH